MRLLGAAGGDHVVRPTQSLVVLFGIADDGFLQGRNAVGRRVPDLAVFSKRGRGIDMLVLHAAPYRAAKGLMLSRIESQTAPVFRSHL